MAALLAAALLAQPAAAPGQYAFVGEWRGHHGNAVGLCTAELIAKQWIITAEHCATRVLKGETDKVQVTFPQGNHIVRGVTHCFKCNEGCGLDVVVCHLKLPIGAFPPVALNLDHCKVTSNPPG